MCEPISCQYVVIAHWMLCCPVEWSGLDVYNISCPSEDLALYVFASLDLREKEEEQDVRKDLHSQGEGRAVWRVRDWQAFIQSASLSAFIEFMLRLWLWLSSI